MYELLDSGNCRKLERFGNYLLDRPCLQAVWEQKKNPREWDQADGKFTRDPDGKWIKNTLPSEWDINIDGIRFLLSLTDFGHLGLFPEQRASWNWIREQVAHEERSINVLNLFAYSGGATIAAALSGGAVCHLDASKKMIQWAKANAALNGLENAPIRWIADDVKKFLKREIKRGKSYDAIILDPPSFGRGTKGEVFKIENDLREILSYCKLLLSNKPSFILFTSHSPGITPLTIKNLFQDFGLPQIEVGEMLLTGESKVYPVPSGCYGRGIYVNQ